MDLTSDRKLKIIVLILVAVYLVQMLTPFRLSYDAVDLVAIAESVIHGDGYLYHGKTTVFPPGYPSVLAVLLKLGMFHPWVIIGINIAAILSGLWAVGFILRRHSVSNTNVLEICILTLLSMALMRYSFVPLTDPPFFGIGMCTLAAIDYTSRLPIGRRFWFWLVGCCILLIISMSVRRIGIALIPSLVWALLFHPEIRTYLNRFSIITRAIIGSLMAIEAAAIWWVVAAPSFFRDLSNGRCPAGATAPCIMHFRLAELGEILLNYPYHVLPANIAYALPWFGILMLSFVVGGFILKRRDFGPMEVFVICYAAILAVWPYRDARFFLPVIPLLFSYAARSVRYVCRHVGGLRILLVAYLAIFVVGGILALTRSTLITFGGKPFADFDNPGFDTAHIQEAKQMFQRYH